MPESSDARQKQDELTLFEQFARLLPGVSSGEVSQPDPPEPDIVVTAQGKLIGIEITQPRPTVGAHRQNEGEQDGITNAAAQIYEASGGPPVSVRVHWSPHAIVSKRERQSLAQSLADVVRLRLPQQNAFIDLEPTGERTDPLPRQLSLLQISRSQIYERSQWYCPRGASVSACSREEIEERLRAKEPKLVRYRQEYEQVWLLLAIETGGPSTWRVVPEWLLEQQFDTRFHRAFILEAKHNRLRELRVRDPEQIDRALNGQGHR